MDNRDVEHLSKMLSLMLRHRPEEFGVEVDRYGYADLNAVLVALQDRSPSVTMEDVEHLVYEAEKQRFEIENGRIRARYGHSIPIEIDREPVEPPEFLYQEVFAEDLGMVKREGLVPRDRQYVHLSFDPHRETRQGRRGGPQVVVRVRAREAHAAGLAFYDCGPTILTAEVPPAFLDIPDLPPPQPRSSLPVSPDLPETSPDTNKPSAPVTFGRVRKTVRRR
ncbi:MAG: RNA 2'-phosphotransferase [Candidatus Latescibacteria bacterium]|nr:RNA 2'-phosphotransferase [Candidatus Latescibacterota bacterium]